MARQNPERFARAGFTARCWACGAQRSTFAEGGQIRLRNDCRCPPEGSPECATCGVRGGHALLCPVVAKKEPTPGDVADAFVKSRL